MSSSSAANEDTASSRTAIGRLKGLNTKGRTYPMASFRILLSIMTVSLYVGGIACAIVALPFPPNVSSPGNFLWMASLAYVALAVWAILRGLLRNGVLCLMGGVVGAIVVAGITPAYGRVYEQYVAENSDAVAGVLHALTLITLVLPIYYLIRDRRDTHKQVRGEDRDRSREQRYLLYLAYAHYANAIILGVVGFISLLYQSIYVFLLTVDRAHATRESSHMLDNSLVIGASLFTVSLAAVVAFSAYFLQRRINYRACWAVAWIEFICIPMGPILGIVTLRLLSSPSIKRQFVDAGTK